MKLIDYLPTADGYREVLESDPSEKILKRIRKWRDAELVATDWTQLQDAPVDKDAWAQYRQALRDLPESNSDPREIDLPVRP